MNAKLTLAIAVIYALGCGGREEELERPREWLEQPLALGDALVLIETVNPRAFVLDVSAEPFEQQPIVAELPHDPRSAWKRNGTNEALVLCMGRRASVEQDSEPAALAVLASDGTVRSYPLGTSPFDSLSQSGDGRYAFLFKKNPGMRLLDNPNEIAIVDLDLAPNADGAITLRTLRSFGDSPLSVVFSPQMRIVGEDRRLAVVLSETNVTLIDLDHLDRAETTVQLSSPGGGAVSPAQVLFNPDAPEIYVRGAGSDDVFVFNLAERPPGDERDESADPHNDFRPFIDQLGVGGRPSDMALYAGDDGARLLVLADGQSAAVVSAGTSEVTSVALPVNASRTLLFNGISPRDGELAERALLYSEGGQVVMFLDLEDLEARGNRNLEVLPLGRPIAKLVPMPEEQRVLILHGSEGVSLLDLEGRTISPITSNAVLTDALFDAERGQLWVAPANQRFVGLLDLATGDTPEVLLDAEVDELVPMFDAGHVVVLHPSTVGHLTVLDADRPTREHARSLRGFLVADLLDRGE
jgi:hypothetical protein